MSDKVTVYEVGGEMLVTFDDFLIMHASNKALRKALIEVGELCDGSRIVLDFIEEALEKANMPPPTTKK